MRLTVEALKAAANWSQVLGMPASDPRWLSYLNETLERFVNNALWDRCVQRYRICTSSACVTWPRQFMGLEVIEVCNQPMAVRNQWFEFLENGPGLASLKGCSPFATFDRGRGYAMFDDLNVTSKIRLYPRFTSDIGKRVTIRGVDQNGQQVITGGGTTIGEVMTLKAPFVDSTTTWMRQVIREVIKEKTAGHVLAYSYDASLPVPPSSPGALDTPLTALADWEPTETLPDYRRSFIPYLAQRRNRCNVSSNLVGIVQEDEDTWITTEGGIVISTEDQTQTPVDPNTLGCCNKTTVTVIAKLQHIPVESDLDFLPISNVSALKLGMLSVMLEERLDWNGAARAWQGQFDPYQKKYVGGAMQLLNDELSSFQGQGTVSPVRLESNAIAGAYVRNII